MLAQKCFSLETTLESKKPEKQVTKSTNLYPMTLNLDPNVLHKQSFEFLGVNRVNGILNLKNQTI